MRPLVSYDDIAPQASAPEASHSTYAEGSRQGSPPKKRRKNNNRQGQRHRNATQNFKDDGNEDASQVSPSPKKVQKVRQDYGIEEESRPLTHEEVWDDSALIHAWDAAVEEYKVLNGPDKKWKNEPVNKSALWFNTPPEQETSSHTQSGPAGLVPSIPAIFQSLDNDAEPIEPFDPENSRPVDFDTFVPRHDPSNLHANGSKGNGTGVHSSAFPPAPGGVVGQVTKDQAFERAMSAWYWAGYWSGVYHTANGTAASTVPANEEESEREVDGVEDEEVALNESPGEDRGVVEEDLKDLIPT